MSAANAGLVPSSTSLTQGFIAAVSKDDVKKGRIKRTRRTVLNSCRSLLRQRRGFRDKWKMVTLTYSESEVWQPKDCADFLQRVRMWFKRRRWSFSYVWVMELTKRGRPHYHVLIRMPYRGTLPKADKQGWWSKGSTNTETARNAVGYLAKYVSKGCEEHDFPKGARIHGAAGLNAESRVYVQFWNLPVWAREQLKEVIKTKRIKGGFVNTVSGEFLACPFTVTFECGVLYIWSKEA